MKNQKSRSVPRVQEYLDFTSPDNSSGIPIDVRVKGDRAYSTVVIPEHMVGWRSPDQAYAHKGAIATVLDTVMAFAGIHFLKRATNTKSLSIEYFTQVPVNTKLRAHATLALNRGDTEAIFESVLRDSDGTVLAKGTGTYALYSVDELRNLEEVAFSELALGPNVGNFAACRPGDLAQFENMLQTM